MNGYTCCMCKKYHEGQPSLKNAAGCFCQNCYAIVKERMADGMKNRTINPPSYCKWCGKPLNQVRVASKRDENVWICAKCEEHRNWLLSCIRHSEWAARYVARVEIRDAPARKEREQQAARQQQEQSILPVQQQLPTPDESSARLARVEMMLNSLITQLGV